jgi:hypothetical protein
MNKKINSIIAVAIIIVIAAIVGAGIWFLAHGPIQKSETANKTKNEQKADTTNETANWKIYTDAKLGISFKYPEGKLNTINFETVKYKPTGEYINDEEARADGLTSGYWISQDWHIPPEVAAQLLANPNCSLLDKLSHSTADATTTLSLLPPAFNKPNLCGAAKRGDLTIFYVAGYPIPDSSNVATLDDQILILKKNEAFRLFDPTFMSFTKNISWRMRDDFGPVSNSADPKWIEIINKTKSMLDKEMDSPSPDTVNDFKIFGQIANTISTVSMLSDKPLPSNEQKELKQAVLDAQINDKSMEGHTTKTITIDYVDNSQKAAIGTWRIGDVWGWISWKDNNEKWVVLLNTDGYDCKDLEKIPPQYADFFQSEIYRTDPTKTDCYDHNK